MEPPYPNIIKHLGRERLEKELKPIESGEFLEPGRENDGWLGYFALKLVDNLIGENEGIENFSKWVKEARESKDLKSCLFELICIDNISKNNTIIIHQKNGNKFPDAFLSNKNTYIEMTNLEGISQSIKLKANDMCYKSKERFGNENGIHFIGVNGFFEYSDERDMMVPKKELEIFVEDLKEKVLEMDENISCFILIHSFFQYNPKTKQFMLHKQTPYIISNRDNEENFLKDIFPGLMYKKVT